MEPESKSRYATWIAVGAVAAVLLVIVLIKAPADPKDDFAEQCAAKFTAEVCAATLLESHSGCLDEAKPRREISEEEYRANPGNGRTEIGPLNPETYRECMMRSASASAR